MKIFYLSLILATSILFAQEFKSDPSDSLSKLNSKESQTVSDNMLEIQNLQLQLQGIQIRLQQSQAKYSSLEIELALKYEKTGCTLSLKRDWICPPITKSE